MLLTIIAAVFVFGLLVLVHELGHFITAKMTGMRVDEFAIGFGPVLCSFRRGETLYALRAIPLGGFNRIAGMEVGEDKDAGDRAYWRRPVWARMIVILAGSFMNFVLPIIIFFGIFAFEGVTMPSSEPIVGTVVAGKPADLAGLQSGDKIISIEGNEIGKWQDIASSLQNSEGKPLQIVYDRNGTLSKATIIPISEPETNRTIIGITGMVKVEEKGVFEAATLAVAKTKAIVGYMLSSLVDLVQGKGSAEISGPVGVAQMAGEVAKLGVIPLLNFAALLSLNLGIINLLPIPALDGGHFFTLVLEAVRGKPLGQRVMTYVQTTGVVILLSLMLYATINDIAR